MKSILDPSFRYTNAASTDVRKTFARIRRQQAAAEARAAQAPKLLPAPLVQFIAQRKKA